MDWSQINHFTRSEFGQGETEPKESLVRLLDAARGLSGIPFVLTSGLRTRTHNAAVGGVPDSAHISGHAADIRCRSSIERYKIVDSLLASGAMRVGISQTFVHVDTDDTKPQGVIWLY